jgi:hypothetical protein
MWQLIAVSLLFSFSLAANLNPVPPAQIDLNSDIGEVIRFLIIVNIYPV